MKWRCHLVLASDPGAKASCASHSSRTNSASRKVSATSNAGSRNSADVSAHVIRLWLPDRPGTLGRVAAAIGSVGADVTGIEILERGAGMAIDEVTIEVPDTTSVDDVVVALARVDGVAVEDVRRLDDERLDHGVMGLSVLADFIESNGDVEVLVAGLRRLLEADWVAIVDRGRPAVLVESGEVPDPSWLVAFLAGTV
ncbi:MAG: ACT domain-containing protein, partial [Actinobacteria bacterium]|nr:ACT domain-containing protein [Actinomycetota bacterium]